MPSQPIALSLSHSPLRHRADTLLSLGERLLELLHEHAADDIPRQAPAFRALLDAWRRELHDEDSPARLPQLVEDIARECASFLDNVRDYRTDREAELIDLVNVLREVVDTVRGESVQFEHEMLRSTTALDRMVEIEDIRELKRALSSEVRSLRQTVTTRQQNEARHFATLNSRVASLEKSLVQAKTEAATDALTQLPNRGAFDTAVREWVDRAARDGSLCAVAMVDLDDFKRINDTFGHPVGDRVIVAAAQLLRGGVGPDEFVSRFGGEEFALLLRASTAKARERLTTLLEQLPPSFAFQGEGGVTRHLTFSFSAGVTGYTSGDTPDSIVKRADEALYDAKRRGKKRVEARPQSFLRGLMR